MMATDRLSEFKLGTGDEIKVDRDCVASGCLELQCICNCHVFQLFMHQYYHTLYWVLL